MTWIILIAMVAALLVLRQPLLVILLSLIFYAQTTWGRGEWVWVIEDMFVSLDKELILAIPMFILCGGVMTKGGTARRLVNVARALTGHLPGGLGVATSISCGIFAAISGSSIVTMLAVGSVLYPAMRDAGYSQRFALGSVMSGGTLGIIIPPSIPLILYGLVTETSIVDLFRAGIGPGILLVSLMAIYAVIVNWHMPKQPFSLTTLKSEVKQGFWSLLMPFILLGGIYSGKFSPTEAASVALVYAIFIEIYIHKDIKWSDLRGIVLDGARLGGSLFPLIAIALSLNLLLIDAKIPQTMLEYTESWISNPLTFIVLVNILLLVVGALMTTGEAILILAPILAPIALHFGFDKVVFGIIMIINLEIGLLTPPVGLNLIVAMTAYKKSFAFLARAAVPFIFIMLFGLALICWQPSISMLFVD